MATPTFYHSGVADTILSFGDTIMSKARTFETTLRDRRVLRGWSQDELARRSGLSRAGVSAIETGRLVPSAAAALALAAAFQCTVEDLFRLAEAEPARPVWAWPPNRVPSRYWVAEVAGKRILFPTEAAALGMQPHDGVHNGGDIPMWESGDASRTLVLAGCDPAVGLLAAELARASNVRLIALSRSSRAALDLLGKGLVHVAGVHLSKAGRSDHNQAIVRETLGSGYRLVRVARWEEGITFASQSRLSTIRAALRSKLRWIGREPGSGARACLDELLEGRNPPRRMASDHRGVAEAIRNDWADLGVCLRLVSEEAGLGFLHVRQEDYDLCFPESLEADHRVQALLRALRSPSYRAILGELPGYDSRETGDVQPAL